MFLIRCTLNMVSFVKFFRWVFLPIPEKGIKTKYSILGFSLSCSICNINVRLCYKYHRKQRLVKMYCYDLFLHVSRLNSKKTIFDIMGVVYEYNGLKNKKKVAQF